MMDLRELIPQNEMTLMTNYVDHYAINDCEGSLSVHEERRASMYNVLNVWSNAKSPSILGMIFNKAGSLIISEDIAFKTPEFELHAKLDGNHDIWQFQQDWRTWTNRLEKKFSNEGWDWDKWRAVGDALWDLVHADTLIQNCYNGDTVKLPAPNGHELIIAHGCKPVKMIGKINQAFQVSEHFEAFRIAVSMILNVKTIKGKLCLSIHPMDYMTMSDNDCDWDSCMSWRNWGSYRQGTVEMMNSPYVMVAYLAASEPMQIFDQEWSNKKWRSLYIVHPDIITNIKGYPYQIPEVDKLVIEKIKHLMKDAGFNAEYSEVVAYDGNTIAIEGRDIVEVSFRTSYMYNDFGSITHYGCVRVDDKASYNFDVFYSGKSQCVWCGNEYRGDSEEALACNYCFEETRCDCCGELMHSTSLIETGDGDWVCESCLCDYYLKSFDNDDYYRSDNMARVFVVPDELKLAIECDELCPEKFNWDVPYIMDHVSEGLHPDDNWSNEQFQRFLNDGEEIHYKKQTGWYGNKYIPYIFLSQLKDEWKKSFVDRYGYCEYMLGDNFYNQWRFLDYTWSTEEAAKKWIEGLEEKVPA